MTDSQAGDAMRRAINQELHARPYVRFQGPAHALHLSLGHLHGAEEEGPAALVSAFGLRATYEAPRHGIYAGDLPGVGHVVLAWAHHTSYTSLTLYLYGLKEAHLPIVPFAFDLASVLPAGWLDARRDRLLTAVRLTVMPADGQDVQAIASHFEAPLLNASQVMGGAATVFSDHRLDADGFGRLLVRTGEMSREELGRTVQRLLNVEDYYHLALSPLPQARRLQPRLAVAEHRLSETMQAISRAEAMADKRQRLDELMALAVEIERDLVVHNMLFSPAFSYFELLKSSIAELREGKVAGLLPISVFLLRRVNPAVQTYTSLQARLSAMSERIARAAELLRTAIELSRGEWHQAQLVRQDERARVQLRLQETVEGLSVIAISYYMVGLLGYGLKGLKAAGWSFDVDVAIAWALPGVVGLVWLGSRWVRRRLHVRQDSSLRPSDS